MRWAQGTCPKLWRWPQGVLSAFPEESSNRNNMSSSSNAVLMFLSWLVTSVSGLPTCSTTGLVAVLVATPWPHTS